MAARLVAYALFLVACVCSIFKISPTEEITLSVVMACFVYLTNLPEKD